MYRLKRAVCFVVLCALIAAYFGHVAITIRKSPQPLVFTGNHQSGEAIKPLDAQIFRGLPVRLKFPAIGVDTAIEFLGNTALGNMAAPSNPMAAGWYKYGAIPGETGSSVMAGHVVGPKGEPGIFKHLSESRVGDSLEVFDAKGQAATFTVREIKKYDESQQHAEVFTSASGTHLNLITCAGGWDEGRREYRERLVVFTDMVARAGGG